MAAPVATCERRDKHRVVQIHPTLRCNLACLHCYSSSGPDRREGLPYDLIADAITDSAAEGYTALAASGGEPLMWDGLERAFGLARDLGLVTALTTNGMSLSRRRLAGLRPVTDFIAVSLDGIAATHDRTRARDGAFATMAARLPDLQASGIPFGFIFTLTRTNLDELPAVAGFALDHGAALLQIHPLETAGRAERDMAGQEPDSLIANAAYLATLRLRQRLGDRLPVQLDLAHREVISAEPWRCYRSQPPKADDEGAEPGLADVMSSLVIEADGTVSPLHYGFDRRHRLGNLKAARLPRLAAAWRQSGGLQRFEALCAAAASEATANADALPAFDWYEALASTARHLRTPMPAMA